MSVYKNAVSLAVLAVAMTPVGALAEAIDDQSLIETVVVTAQKREQNPVDVPMAITAYSGKFMTDVGIQEFDKLSLFVPGFVVQNQSPNNPGFGLRGLTLDSGEAAQEPRVSVFEDDVSISTTRATYIELFDIERVEVVKGPQTTLFGRAALMGGVNVIQNKAKIGKYDYAASLETGDYNYHMLEGMVNLPVSDSVAVRLAARYKMRNGYIENLGDGDDYNSVDTLAGRLSVAWKPIENFTLDVIVNGEVDRPSGTSFKSGTFYPADVNGTIVGNLGHTSGAALTDHIAGFENGKSLGLSRKVWDVKGLTDYKIGPQLTLSTVTAYRRFDSLEVFDPDGFAQPMLQSAEDERGDQFSHEMRLNYDYGDRLTAFGGVSYFYSNVSQRVPLQFNENMALALISGQSALLQYQPASFFSSSTFTGGYAPALIKGIAKATVYSKYYNAMVGNYGAAAAAAYATSQATAYVTANNAILNAVAAGLKSNHWEEATNYGKTKSVDLYGDVTYRLTDQFELNAGARYTHDDKTTSFAAQTADTSYLGMFLKNAASGTGWGIIYQPTKNNGDKISRDFSDDGLSWRFSARYAPEDNTSFYATYARGRRPEVLSAKSPTAPNGDPTFTPAPAELVDSYEIGAKTFAMDGKLRLDAALYFYDYTNFQSSRLESGEFVSFNAGKAEAYGFESTMEWAVADRADLFATYTYNRARFVGASIYQGNKFRLNPDHKFSVGASIRQDLFGGTFNFLPTYTWQSKIYFDDDDDIASEQDNLIADTKLDEFQKPYGLLNLRLTWQPEGRPWSISAYASNVLDQKYIKDAGNSGDNLGIPTFIAGEPRFFGMSISLKMQ
jgi:iron complex outermembrane recepter protein